jgi:hypothetical protein
VSPAVPSASDTRGTQDGPDSAVSPCPPVSPRGNGRALARADSRVCLSGRIKAMAKFEKGKSGNLKGRPPGAWDEGDTR